MMIRLLGAGTRELRPAIGWSAFTLVLIAVGLVFSVCLLVLSHGARRQQQQQRQQRRQQLAAA